MSASNEDLDALRELMNIGVGRAAGALNDMIGRTICLNVPSVRLIESEEVGWALGREKEDSLACVRLGFGGGLAGVADLVFPSESASKLMALLTGEDDEGGDLDSLRAGALTEVGNILLNGLMGSITNVVGEHVDYGLPVYVEETAANVEQSLRSAPDAAILLAQTQFFVGASSLEVGGERINGEITLLLGVASLQHLVDRLHCLGEENRV